jgi:hypothetical protein
MPSGRRGKVDKRVDTLSNRGGPRKCKAGSAELVETVLKIIAQTKAGARQPMSTNEMIRIVMEDRGIPPQIAVRMPTKVRRGGPLHEPWKAAFKDGRFIQKNGRPPTGGKASSKSSKHRYTAFVVDQPVKVKSPQGRKKNKRKSGGTTKDDKMKHHQLELPPTKKSRKAGRSVEAAAGAPVVEEARDEATLTVEYEQPLFVKLYASVGSEGRWVRTARLAPSLTVCRPASAEPLRNVDIGEFDTINLDDPYLVDDVLSCESIIDK